jgi:protein SCO1/2
MNTSARWLVPFALMLAPAFPANTGDGVASLYEMHEKLTDQDGRQIDLDVHRGHKVLVTMFYGSCPATCPLIIDTLRSIERKLDAAQNAKLRVLLVSFDSENDSPAALQRLAQSRRLDTSRWTLAHADPAAVRRIAAALDIQYKKLPSGQFSHATIISALDEEGGIMAQSAQLGHADPDLLAVLEAP